MASSDLLAASHAQPFRVGPWLVEPKACLLTSADSIIKLRPQLVDLLVCLARRAGEIVLKEEILAEVWAGQFVAESALSRCIAELRQTLGDEAQAPRYIETITKRGYRLVAPVTWQLRAAEPPAEPGVAEVPAESPGAVDAIRRRFTSPRAWAAVGLLLVVMVAVFIGIRRRNGAEPLRERDLVLTAFENRTGDRVFDETIPLALSIQLEQSPFLDLVPASRVQEALRMMKRSADTPLTRTTGLEACERIGARALIVTSLASLGRQYAIGLEAVACGTNRVLARRLITAERKELVLTRLQGAAVDIRKALGEPAASLDRYSLPPVEATTASLEALRALRRGDLARDRGEDPAALDFYREAVSLDPEFALAHSRRARLAQGYGTEAEAREAFERAYALRHRVSLIERLEIEAMHARFIRGDLPQFAKSLEQLRENYPRRAWIRHLLSFALTESGRYDQAFAEALEARRLEPDSRRIALMLARSYMCLNRVAEARTVSEAALASGGDGGPHHLLLLQCAHLSNDSELLARERTWSVGHPGAVGGHIFEVEADYELSRGRLREALAVLEQHEAWALSAGRPTDAAIQRLWMARYEALVGFSGRAVHRLSREAKKEIPPPALIEAARAAMAVGDVDLVVHWLDRANAARADGIQPDTVFDHVYRAAIAARTGSGREGLARLAELEPLDLAFLYEYVPLFERAQACFRAGEWGAARQAYQKLLSQHVAGTEWKLVPLAELGLARTLAKLGDVVDSRHAYEQLFERWRAADPDLPLLLDARQEYAALR